MKRSMAFALLMISLAPQFGFAGDLSEAEKKAGFESLVVGKSLEGWDHQKNWKVDAEGVLTREGKGGGNETAPLAFGGRRRRISCGGVVGIKEEVIPPSMRILLRGIGELCAVFAL